ncbi:MAG: hypothetical protein WDO56_21855 [Gammaproteobacteria bacterium]
MSVEPSSFWVGGVQATETDLVVTVEETVIAKAGSAVAAFPSLAAISMPEKVPTSVAAGVPESTPVVASKAAHAGLFAIVNVTLSLSASLAVGLNW